MNKEVWKDIKGFEGHYQVSNLGRVKSIKFRKERILKPAKDGEFIQEWKSTHDIERNLGYFQTYISACCLGKYKSAYSFVWKYKN